MTEPDDIPEIADIVSQIQRPAKRRGEIGDKIRRDTGELLRTLHDGHNMSLREVTLATGLSYGYVRTCLIMAGATMRPRGTNHFPGHVLTRSAT